MIKHLEGLYILSAIGTSSYIAGSYPARYFPWIWCRSIVYGIIWPYSWYKICRFGESSICYDLSKDSDPHAIAYREYLRTGDLSASAEYLRKTLYGKK